MIDQVKPTEGTKRAYTGLADYAAAHGTPVDAYRAAGWFETQHKGRPALAIPTATGTRHRYIDGGKQRFISPFGYQPCWYGLTNALEIAQRTGQLLVICNGEPSVVAAQAAGVAACSRAGGGENILPDGLLDELKQAWHGAILVALDCDDAGRGKAPKLAAQLVAAGYEARAVDLELWEHADIADFCDQHGAQSVAALAACSALPTLAPDLPSPAYSARPRSEDGGRKQLPAAFIDAIEQALGIDGEYNHKGYSRKPVKCPLHSDEHPTAYWNHDKQHLKCFVCHTDGEQALAKAVGLALGLRLSDYYDRPTSTSWKIFQDVKPRKPHNKGFLANWGVREPDCPERAPIELIEAPARDLTLRQLPDTWRALLNTRRYIYPAIAPVCELILEADRAGLLNAADTDIPEIMAAAIELGRNTNETTIRRGIEEGIKAEFLAPVTYMYSYTPTIARKPQGRHSTRFGIVDRPTFRAALERQIAPRIIEAAFPVDNATVAPIRARLIEMLITKHPAAADGEHAPHADLIEAQPEYAKRLTAARREFENIRQELEQMVSTPLPMGWHYKNASEYKAAYARAILDTRPNIEGKRVLACKIGASTGALDRLLDKAGAVAIARTADVPMFDSDALDMALPLNRKTGYIDQAYDTDVDGRPCWLVVNGVERSINRDELQEARRVLDGDEGTVQVRYQCKSTFEVVSADQPAPPAPKERAARIEKPAPVDADGDELVTIVTKLGPIGPKLTTMVVKLVTIVTKQPRPAPFWGATYSPDYAAANLEKLRKLIEGPETVWNQWTDDADQPIYDAWAGNRAAR